MNDDKKNLITGLAGKYLLYSIRTVHVRRKTNKVGEVLIVPIQVPRGDKGDNFLGNTF